MKYLPILALLALAACGADGEPERPGKGETGFDISIGGTAEIGVRG